MSLKNLFTGRIDDFFQATKNEHLVLVSGPQGGGKTFWIENRVKPLDNRGI